MELPTGLINPETGEVTLVLYPFHLDREHGRYEGPERDVLSDAGLPFHALSGADPITLVLKPGMKPKEIEDLSPLNQSNSVLLHSFYKWLAHANTPYGWSAKPTLRFLLKRLDYITFDIHGDESISDRFSTLRSYAEGVFGSAGSAEMAGWFRRSPVREGEQADCYVWTQPWGEVSVFIEPRDGEPVLAVRWKKSR